MSAAKPAWYPNPDKTPTLRYFDGQTWTDHVCDLPNPQNAQPQTAGRTAEAGGEEAINLPVAAGAIEVKSTYQPAPPEHLPVPEGGPTYQPAPPEHLPVPKGGPTYQPTPPGYGPTYPPYSPYPSAYPGTKTLPVDTNATTGLICALSSLLVMLLFFPAAPILTITALILAHKSQKTIDQSNQTLDGTGLNIATKIIGWISVGIYAIATLLLILLLAAIIEYGADGSGWPAG